MQKFHIPLLLLICCLSLLAFESTVLAAPAVPVEYTLYPHLDSVTYPTDNTTAVEAFSLFGSSYFAAANEVSGVHIYRVVNGAAVEIGQEQALGRESDIAVVDWFAYVATTNVGLSVLSMGIPENPLFVASLSLPDGATEVVAAGTHAYVVCGNGELAIVDVSNANTMSVVATHGTAVSAISLSGDRLALINAGQFELLDVAAPSSPVLIGSYASAPGVSFDDVIIQGDIAYAAGTFRLERLNLSNPGAITGTDEGIESNSLTIDGTDLLVAGNSRLQFIDMTSGDHLRASASLKADEDVASIDGLIVTCRSDRLEFFSDGLHEAPLVAGTYFYGDSMHPLGIMFQDVLYGHSQTTTGGLAATELGGSGNNLWDLDLGLGGAQINNVAQGGSLMAALTDAGDLAIATVSRHGATLRGTVGTDMVTPRNDRVMKFFDDQTLVVLDGGDGSNLINLRLFDVTNPDLPTQIGHYPLATSMWNAQDVLIVGSHIVAATNNQVEIFDAQNRLSLQSINQLSLGVYTSRIYAQGSYLYHQGSGGPGVTIGLEMFSALDLSDPLAPVATAEIFLSHSTEFVFAEGWAYQTWSGLILDLSDPANPVPAGNFTPKDGAGGLPAKALASTEYLVFGESLGAVNGTVKYQAAQGATGSISAVGDELPAVGPGLQLAASPNPFNPRVTLQFALTSPAEAHLEIFDLRGRLVSDLGQKFRQAGPHQVAWDGLDTQGRQLPSGVYLARVRAGRETASQKIVLAK